MLLDLRKDFASTSLKKDLKLGPRHALNRVFNQLDTFMICPDLALGVLLLLIRRDDLKIDFE